MDAATVDCEVDDAEEEAIAEVGAEAEVDGGVDVDAEEEMGANDESNAAAARLFSFCRSRAFSFFLVLFASLMGLGVTSAGKGNTMKVSHIIISCKCGTYIFT